MNINTISYIFIIFLILFHMVDIINIVYNNIYNIYIIGIIVMQIMVTIFLCYIMHIRKLIKNNVYIKQQKYNIIILICGLFGLIFLAIKSICLNYLLHKIENSAFITMAISIIISCICYSIYTIYIAILYIMNKINNI